MKNLKTIIIAMLMALAASINLSAQGGRGIYQPDNPAMPLFTLADSTVLFSPGDAGSKFYRIPAICTTNTP